MRKVILSALLATTFFGFISCSDNDDAPYVPVTVSTGIYVLNEGNSYSGINGSLTTFDYLTQETTQNAYKKVNGIELGGTPNDAIVYGSKLYICSSDESMVFVADNTTLKQKKQIEIRNAAGDTKVMPREFLAADGKVYVSTYGSEVLAIDTVSLTVTARYACGTNAEGMAITADGKTLYVANSDGYTYKGSISAINLTDGTTKTIENSGIKNPTRIFVVNGQVYFLDMGSYDPVTWTQSGEGLYRLTDNGSVKLTEESEVKYHAGKFYLYHARYGETATYSVYDLSTGKESTFIDGTDIAAPATIAIDPVLGSVIITSYNLSGGYADYSTDGYAVIYDAAGIKQKQFVTGVGPTTVVFNTVLK